MLRGDPTLATAIGEKLSAAEARLIAQLITRDLPWYDAAISPEFVAAMNRFSRDVAILEGDPDYSEIVATQFRELWT